ncbi:MAG: sulfotransferase [Novosphingobium sp.]|nr:sulfotransferase [Novosphingobium sp.]
MTPPPPRFLLGIGCQKAGTSWLYDHLRTHPEVFLPSPKELHVFDAALRPDMFSEFYERARYEHAARSWHRKLRDRLGLTKAGGRVLGPGERVAMISDPEVYARYFAEWSRQYPVVGEITPSYAALSADDFGYIRELLEPRFDLRVVLLLRDPVQRAWSAARHFRKINRGHLNVAVRGNDNDLFARLYDTPYIRERADYRRILSDLKTALPSTQVHVEFYERLFTQDAISKLCDFLGIETRQAEFGKMVNVSPRPIDLDPDLAAAARKAYAPIYEFCADWFGQAEIDRLWPAGAV